MSALRRLVCLLFRHVPPLGVRRDMSIVFVCARCGAFADGDFTRKRK
jgi:hypothetical protein